MIYDMVKHFWKFRHMPLRVKQAIILTCTDGIYYYKISNRLRLRTRSLI